MNAFELTMFGRDMIRKYINRSISKGEILNKVNNDMGLVKDQISDLRTSLDELEHKLNSIEDFIVKLSQTSSDESRKQMRDLSKSDLISVLQIAEQSAGKNDKMGLLYSTELYLN